ncbi:flagellar basal body P-ring protein FlgI [Paludisphaera mucosa]|uniref:Flagellar basal body P-ring protein FlgI n=1 Tax=Paludisphaera mucosa TaxID=3030827 RepID=A0ABT6FDE1_9BACT|nr:flagellar basal body P-ring protein FlgI [Paludisphaera mucosa]MDG3005602.1 flagellar basal body P-ring protein FlgI [Paludisphaera mucosa]
MRRTVPRRSWALGALVAIAALAVSQVGAGPLTKKRAAENAPKVDESVGDLAYVFQNGETAVEGVGLVSGLDGTGGDTPPSWHRDQLVDEMAKAGVEYPSKKLESKQFALVIVRMKIPTGAAPRDRFDVELELPPASSVKSLAGGYLMHTRLREVLHASGAPKTGSELGSASGAVMIGDAKDGSNPKAGRVLGGGRVKKDHPYKLILKDNRRFVRNAGMIEKVVNERFRQNEHGQKKGASTAKTDTYLELRVPDVYHQNQERYFRVVQLLPMVDTPQLREKRVAATARELLDPKTSGVAALKLEALGPSAAQALEAGLKSEDPHVRFFAAEALAYLDQASGVKVLGETAVAMQQYRAYALAALAAMDEPTARARLRHLMDESDIEVRYGAFNAMRMVEPNDATLGQVRILDDPRSEEGVDDESPDAMAVAIINSRRPRPEDPFALYIVDSEGPPVVHVSRTRRSEIVVFGRGQNLVPPLVLGQGDILLNAADHDDAVDISKIVPSRFGDSDVKIHSSLEIGEVIRHVARLGATYPDVVAIIEAADRQKNLPGPLFVDSVPKANMKYLNKALLGKDEAPKMDEEVKTASGSFLRRMFNIRGREDDGAKKPDKADKSDGDDSDDAKAADAADSKTAGSKAKSDARTKSDAKGSDAKASDDAEKPAAKKDDALQKTSGEAASASSDDSSSRPGRPRMFDVFRRRGE